MIITNEFVLIYAIFFPEDLVQIIPIIALYGVIATDSGKISYAFF
jgi:hypothetical protein